MLNPALASWEIHAGVASVAFGVAGAVLSVFVVLRRWAFMGEGISHAGLSGVGTALLISIYLPALNNEMGIYLFAAGFALATSMAVAWVSPEPGTAAWLGSRNGRNRAPERAKKRTCIKSGARPNPPSGVLRVFSCIHAFVAR